MCLKDAKPVKIPEAIGYKFIIRRDAGTYESLFACPMTADEPRYHKGVEYQSSNSRGIKRLMLPYVPGFHAYASLEDIRGACNDLAERVTKSASTRLVMVKVKLEEIHTVGIDMGCTCYVAKYQTIMEEV